MTVVFLHDTRDIVVQTCPQHILKCIHIFRVETMQFKIHLAYTVYLPPVWSSYYRCVPFAFSEFLESSMNATRLRFFFHRVTKGAI